MQPPLKPWQVPLRLVTGAYILNSGLSKLSVPPEQAGQYHGMAAAAYPQVRRVPAPAFVRLLASAEVAIGALLLAPVVPSGLAGLALTGFAAGLAGLYLRTPGAREQGSLRPTPQGIPLAKDSWLLAIGLALLTDALGGGRPRPARRRARPAARRRG